MPLMVKIAFTCHNSIVETQEILCLVKMLFDLLLLLLKSKGIRTTPQKQCQIDFVKQSSNNTKGFVRKKKADMLFAGLDGSV